MIQVVTEAMEASIFERILLTTPPPRSSSSIGFRLSRLDVDLDLLPLLAKVRAEVGALGGLPLLLPALGDDDDDGSPTVISSSSDVRIRSIIRSVSEGTRRDAKMAVLPGGVIVMTQCTCILLDWLSVVPEKKSEAGLRGTY